MIEGDCGIILVGRFGLSKQFNGVNRGRQNDEQFAVVILSAMILSFLTKYSST